MKAILFLLTCILSTNELNADGPIIKLYEEFKPAMALTDTLTLDQWTTSLPTDSEKDEMFRLIDLIYQMDTFDQLNNSILSLYFPKLANSVELTIIDRQFCVIHEPFSKTDPNYKFPRFFGFTVIRCEQNATNRLHHSAAHFETDGGVCLQASSVFESTGAKSLVVAGASRWAVKDKIPSLCQQKEAIADAAHNTNLLFHISNVAIWEAAKKYSPTEKFTDHFIQWHGMAETSCPKSPAFLSIGASGNHKAYEDVNLYANKLKTAINEITRVEFAQTPKSDTSCNLKATTNVFGRVINGVNFGFECHAVAVGDNIKGNFLHIEQKRSSRDNLTLWSEAFKKISNHKSSYSNDDHSYSMRQFGSFVNILSTTLILLVVFRV